MESKSLRLVGAALAGLTTLALVGVDAWLPGRVAERRSWRGVGLAICALLGLLLLGRDARTVGADLRLWVYGAPQQPGDWRIVRPTWLGLNPRTRFGTDWAPAVQALDRAVRTHCRREATSPLFEDLHLIVDPRDSSYAAGLTPRHHYVPELQAPFLAPLLEARGCLLVHSGGALGWPGGHGRLHGEGLIRQLAEFVQDRRDPSAQVYHEATRVQLPDGHAVIVYQRPTAATLDEKVAWAERLARWMPAAGLWAGFWHDLGGALHEAGRQTEACLQLQRAAAARPLRGLAPCERVEVNLCLDANLPARQAEAEARQWQCPPAGTVLWPAGAPVWLARGPAL